MKTHLATHEDQVYLQKTAQGKTGKIMKKRQARLKKKQRQNAEVQETSQHLVLDNEEIDMLTVAQLDKQLNFHHDNEKNLVPALHLIPARTTIGDRDTRIMVLKDAVKRYLDRLEALEGMDVEEDDEWAGIST
ncbi:hypothetical protein BKA70DRAFT_1423379 [Coprinopsis sp. MPI-PUGE-AT-0042]|nr:hypothetical protein BKA70DRAFT_1423379 [Coprinopsis sp. MPI-PUGE-AT-0042]